VLQDADTCARGFSLPAGHFDWAPRPDEEVFAETPVPVTSAEADAAAAADAGAAAAAAAAVDLESSDDEDDGVPGAADDVPSPLKGADPENTEVLVRYKHFQHRIPALARFCATTFMNVITEQAVMACLSTVRGQSTSFADLQTPHH